MQIRATNAPNFNSGFIQSGLRACLLQNKLDVADVSYVWRKRNARCSSREHREPSNENCKWKLLFSGKVFTPNEQRELTGVWISCGVVSFAPLCSIRSCVGADLWAVISFGL
jgi:hypothetical protein